MKRVLKAVLVILTVLVLVVLIGPFLVPVRPLEGLQPPSALAQENSQFLTLPYPGTDGIDIHYRSGGAGEPAYVLLHGFAGSLFTWDEVFDQFAAKGRTFAYDRPPFGLSERLVTGDWSESSPYTPDAAIDQLIALLDSQGIDRAVLVGNSAGGTLALRTALAHPERVTGLILTSPAVYTGGGAPDSIQALLNTPQLRRIGPLVARLLIGEGNSLEGLAYHDPAAISAEQMAKSRLGTQVQDWDSALWEFTATSQSSDLGERLDEIMVPVLVVTGDDDRVIPTEQSVRLAGELPNAELVVIPNCGHVAQEECDVEFMEAAKAWLVANGF